MEIVVTSSTFPFCLYLSCGGVCLKLSVIFLSFCYILRNWVNIIFFLLIKKIYEESYVEWECRSSLFLNIQWKRIYLKICMSCFAPWWFFSFCLITHSFVVLRFQYSPVFQLAQMVIFRCSQSCTLHLFQA